MDEEAKRKGAKAQGRKDRHGATGVGAALRPRMRPKAAHAGEPKGISLRPCAFAFCCSASADSCVSEIREIAALSRPLEFGAEIHGRSAGTWDPAATKPGAVISSLAACFNPKMTHQFCRRSKIFKEGSGAPGGSAGQPASELDDQYMATGFSGYL